MIESAPPSPAPNTAAVARRMLVCGSLRRHHPPGGFGMELQRRIGKARRLQYPPPQQPHGAELRERCEHVLVCSQRDADGPCKMHVVQALERAERGDRRGQRGPQFLCLRRTLFMPAAAIGLHVGARIAKPGQFRRLCGIGQREGHIEPLGVDGLRGDEFRQRHRRGPLDLDRHRMKMDALQHARQLRSLDAVAPRRGRIRSQRARAPWHRFQDRPAPAHWRVRRPGGPPAGTASRAIARARAARWACCWP